MSTHSSGYYSIDADYNIIGFNDTAKELVLSDGSIGHALVFSTVAEGERLASAIPTGEGSLRLLGALSNGCVYSTLKSSEC